MPQGYFKGLKCSFFRIFFKCPEYLYIYLKTRETKCIIFHGFILFASFYGFFLFDLFFLSSRWIDFILLRVPVICKKCSQIVYAVWRLGFSINLNYWRQNAENQFVFIVPSKSQKAQCSLANLSLSNMIPSKTLQTKVRVTSSSPYGIHHQEGWGYSSLAGWRYPLLAKWGYPLLVRWGTIPPPPAGVDRLKILPSLILRMRSVNMATLC